MPGSNIHKVLAQIRDGISRGAYPNETAVRTQIVQRILHELGWDVFDPDKVCNEFPLKLKTTTRRIDLALCVSGGKPRCIIELKATDYDLKQIGKSDGDRQLFEYAFHAGAPIALLTNGINWRFYSTFSAGTYEERLVQALDIQTQPAEDVAVALERYLSYRNTASGQAAHHAKDDLDRRMGQDKAREAIPRAWADLVEADGGGRLVALLEEATAALAENAPARADVIEFLRRLTPADSRGGRRPPRPARKPKPNVDPPGPTPPVQEPARPGGSRSVSFQLLGEEQTAANATRAFLDILTTLAQRDATFLSRMEQRLRGRRRRLIAQQRTALGDHSEVQKSATPLPGGWWVHVNLSNKDKIRHLRTACEVADIPFGQRSGLQIDLPNA